MKQEESQHVPIRLREVLSQYDKVALAFSGGVDSSYLMYAMKVAGLVGKAYFVKTEFQPEFEWRDAEEIAEFCNMPLQRIELSAFDHPDIVQNSIKRCYYCKKNIMKNIIQVANRDGFTTLFDGSNADDNTEERPGMLAARELKIVSPLREAGIDKKMLRQLSKEANLVTWDKPAYACLATRIPTGTPIQPDVLRKVEAIEDGLARLGFSNFRARIIENAVKLQLPEEQLIKALQEREQLLLLVRPYFPELFLDLHTR